MLAATTETIVLFFVAAMGAGPCLVLALMVCGLMSLFV